MREKTFLKSIFKKRFERFVKSFGKSKMRSLTKKQLEDMWMQSNRVRELLSLFESFFSPRIHAEIGPRLTELSERLAETRERESSFLLLERLMPAKGIRTDPPSGIFDEVNAGREKALKRMLKELKPFKPKKIEKELLSDFRSEKTFELSSFVKLLNKSREQLFNQIVDIIRASQGEDLGCLKLQAERFCYLLELAVEGGYQKGKKLLRVVTVLGERLVEIHDEGKFRRLVQNLENERIGDSRQVADIERLRLIQTQLGILQAHTLQALHAHLPVSLQVLKRQLVWK